MRNLCALILVTCLTGCTRSQPDMSPVGGGLAVIGLGIIIAAFICSVFRNGGDND
jgi:hypothetical protein